MLPQRLHQHIVELLTIALPNAVNDFFVQPIGGGSINQSYRLQAQDGRLFFCKINSASRLPNLFFKEKSGLEKLRQTGTIQVPATLAFPQFENHQVLILEWIESGVADKSFLKHFGEQLAALHQHTHTHFGLEEDNYMGSVPQQNTPMQDWNLSFTEQRLQPLVKLCFDKGLLTNPDRQLFQNLFQQLPRIFDDGQKPALVHGDLWSGNFMCNKAVQPILIDPAVYYGHPAVDLGMTTLFGTLDKAFYKSYHYYSPLPPNHQEQWEICNLYPLLIHLYLFGKSYYSAVQQTLKTFA